MLGSASWYTCMLDCWASRPVEASAWQTAAVQLADPKQGFILAESPPPCYCLSPSGWRGGGGVMFYQPTGYVYPCAH